MNEPVSVFYCVRQDGTEFVVYHGAIECETQRTYFPVTDASYHRLHRWLEAHQGRFQTARFGWYWFGDREVKEKNR